jgi:hypothetical protein
MSQDDSNQFSSSQFSQDFGDRIAALSMKSQEYSNGMAIFMYIFLYIYIHVYLYVYIRI